MPIGGPCSSLKPRSGAGLQRAPVCVSDHGVSELLQLADISASALFNAIEPMPMDVEDRYLRNLSPNLYRWGR